MNAVLPIVRDREAAADISQDVWVRFMEYRPQEADNFNLGGWLLTVARRLALNYVASGQVRFRAAVTVEEGQYPAQEPSPAEHVGQAQDRERIEEVLSRLNPRYQAIIRLCDQESSSYAEAGERMGLSEAAVTSLLYRARSAFRRAYLLALAPQWLRSLAETGPVDEALAEIDPFSPPTDLGDAVEQKAHDLFARLAHRWDTIRHATVPDELDRTVAARARLAPGDSALDVGTGTGVVALHVAPLVRRVVGIDRSLPMLKIARDRVVRSGSRNVLMEFGDLQRLPIRPESIDVAFCSLVLRHVKRPKEAVLNIARTLRPGGRMVICDLYRSSPSQAGGVGLSPSHVRAWLADSGLKDIAFDHVGKKGKTEFLVAVAHRP